MGDLGLNNSMSQAPGNNYHGDGIGGLEPQVHKLYFGLRVPGEDFVYSCSPDAFSVLEDYCSIQGDSMTKDAKSSPLLVLGDAGCGKSALLANWLLRRQRAQARSRLGGIGGEDFVFYHAVGCSRQSLSVSSLLRRLITDIKARFELSREVPASQEKLRWELPRFLDLAAKKAKVIIIVIDGLHRLFSGEHEEEMEQTSDDDDAKPNFPNSKREENGANKNGASNAKSNDRAGFYNDVNEGSLSWLPLQFASNVRVVLSATIPTSQLNVNGSDGKVKIPSLHASINGAILSNSMNVATGGGINNTVTNTSAKSNGLSNPLIITDTGSPSGSRAGSPIGGVSAKSINNQSAVNAGNNSTKEQGGSTTTTAPRKHRILQELERRNWNVMRVKPLDKSQCRNIIETYVQKSVHSDATMQATGPFLTAMMEENLFHLNMENPLKMGAAANKVDLDETPGFLLFDVQIQSLLNHSQGKNPLFLRLFLRCSHYAVNRGYSLWRIWDDWLQCESVAGLLSRILKTFETGFVCDEAKSKEDCDRSRQAGGFHALRLLYPWHPTFQAITNNESGGSMTGTLVALDFRNAYGDFEEQRPSTEDDENGVSGGINGGNPRTTEGRGGATPQTANVNSNKGVLSNSVMQSLGDQKWLQVSEQSEAILEESRIHAERSLEDILESIGKRSREVGESFIDTLVNHVKDSKDFNRAGQLPQGRRHTLSVDLMNCVEELSEEDGDEEDDFEDIEEGDEDKDDDEDENGVDEAVDVVQASLSLDGAVEKPSATKRKQTKENEDKLAPIPKFARKSTRKTGRISGKTLSNNIHSPTRDSSNASTTLADSKGKDASNSPDNSSNGKSLYKVSSRGTLHRGNEDNYDDDSVGSNDSAEKISGNGAGKFGSSSANAGLNRPQYDPNEYFDKLPQYLRGGSQECSGFGPLLGDALSLLYVARHGLRESELWSILAYLAKLRTSHAIHLQNNANNNQRRLRHPTSDGDGPALSVRTFLNLVVASRGYLEDTCRGYDIKRNRKITRAQFYRAVTKLHPALQNVNVAALFEELKIFDNINAEEKGGFDDLQKYNDEVVIVDYVDTINRLKRLLRKKNVNMRNNSGSNDTSAINNNIDDDFDNLVVPYGNNSTTSAANSPGSPHGFSTCSGSSTGQTAPPASLGPVMEEALLSVLCALGILHSPENQVFILPCDGSITRKVIKTRYVDCISHNEGLGYAARHQSYEIWHGFLIKFFQNDNHKSNSAAAFGGNMPFNAAGQNGSCDSSSHASAGNTLNNQGNNNNNINGTGSNTINNNGGNILSGQSGVSNNLGATSGILNGGNGVANGGNTEGVGVSVGSQSSMRRCEELPWHLTICRKWQLLRETLSDLHTFDLMVSSPLRDELMSYWLLLSQGPLWLPPKGVLVTAGLDANNWDNNEVKDSGNNQSAFENDNQRVLVEMDTAAVLGLSEKEAKLQLLKNQIAPFDIVEELNKSIDLYVSTNRPSSQRIYYFVSLIAKFLWEYSKQTASKAPFMRKSISLNSLKMFGVAFDDHEGQILVGAQPSVLSLAPTTTTSAPSNNKEKDNEEEKHASTPGQHQEVIEAGFPQQHWISTTHQYYHYFRWIWINFPWLALHNAPRVGHWALDTAALNMSRFTNMTRAGNGVANGTSQSASGAVESGIVNTAVNSGGQTDDSYRFWQVKKQDPSVTLISTTEARKISAIKSCLTPSQALDSLDTSFKRIYEDLLSATQKANNPFSSSKYRRSFQQELNMMKTIPHSEHCQRTVKNGTLFPTLASNIKEENERIEANEDIYREAAQILKRGGQGLAFKPTIEELVARLAQEEAINDYNRKHASAMPVCTPSEVTYKEEFARVNQLRSLADKLTGMRNEKKAQLAKLMNEVESREKFDEAVAVGLVAGETAIAEMLTRVHDLQRGLMDGEQLNKGYQLLLSLCDQCPPATPQHIQRLEAELNLARQQVVSLENRRHEMYLDEARLQSKKKQALLAMVRYYRTAKNEVAIKKRNFVTNSMAKGLPVPFIYRTAGDASVGDSSHDSNMLDDMSIASSQSSQTTLRDDKDQSGQPALSEVMKSFGAAISKRVQLNRMFNGDPDYKKDSKESKDGKDGKDSDSKNDISESSKDNDKGDGINGDSDARVENRPIHHSSEPKRSSMVKIRNNQIEIFHDNNEDEQLDFNNFVGANGLDSTSGPSPSKKMVGSRRGKREGTTKGASSTSNNNSPSSSSNGGYPIIIAQARMTQAKMTVDFIRDRTGFSSAEEFVERFNSAIKMTETLRSHQILADSRLAQLRTEYAELYGSWGDALFLSEPEESQSSEENGKAKTGEHDARYLDQQLFLSELRLMHAEKQLEKSTRLMQEVKMGVGHLLKLLQANASLLQSLPKITEPRLVSDADLLNCVSFLEERLLAINEAMLLESSKPQPTLNSDDPQRGLLASRQSELATVLMEAAIHRRAANASNVNKIMQIKKRRGRKAAGGMSKNIIDVTESQNVFLSSPRGVLVLAASDIDKNYDEKVRRVNEKRDKRALVIEQQSQLDSSAAAIKGVTTFVNEALGNSDAGTMLRKANILSNRKQGRFAGVGTALEDVLRSKGPAFFTSVTEAPPPISRHGNFSPLANTRKSKKRNEATGGNSENNTNGTPHGNNIELLNTSDDNIGIHGMAEGDNVEMKSVHSN